VRGTAAQLRGAISAGNSEHSAVFIAEQNGERAGFAWALLLEDFYTKEPIGKVSEIAVVRSGAGIGQALMARCEQWARERGARLITLNALEGNRHARRFYELNGYAPEYTMYVKRLDNENLAVTRRFDGAADEEHRHDQDEADADGKN
jgi:GNAT superfamily N-acetyltransferase